MEKKFIRVDEVAKELEISESHAYPGFGRGSKERLASLSAGATLL